eukprot:5594738-Amphidinium_carterae.1
MLWPEVLDRAPNEKDGSRALPAFSTRAQEQYRVSGFRDYMGQFLMNNPSRLRVRKTKHQPGLSTSSKGVEPKSYNMSSLRLLFFFDVAQMIQKQTFAEMTWCNHAVSIECRAS